MAKPVQKGKRGENELCEWLKDNLGIEAERRYNQAQGGGDILVDDFVFEVKRRETLNLSSWWTQVTLAKHKHQFEEERNLIPVVAFRQNRQKWEFLIPAEFIGIERGYLRLNDRVFREFAKGVLEGKSIPTYAQ